MGIAILVIGCGEAYEIAKDICKGDSRYKLIEIRSNNNYQYDLNFLNEFNPNKFLCSVALDPFAVNFSRIEVLMEVHAKGFGIASLISQCAYISDSAKLQKGVIIGRNSIIKNNVTIGHGSIIYPGVFIGNDSIIKAHVSVLDCANIEANCTIGLGCTIGRGVTLSKGSNIGRYCELLTKMTYSDNIADRTFYDTSFPNGMFIYNNSST
jgi:carbonic anhydrase/acetyltransferase-like protein (isoleucine patch superfamily)